MGGKVGEVSRGHMREGFKGQVKKFRLNGETTEDYEAGIFKKKTS